MKKRVLVFPCGSEIGLEIYRSLRFSKDFEVYGASSVSDHGEYVYENYIDNVPFVDSDDFLVALNSIVPNYQIALLLPAHDSVVLKLAQSINEIDAKIVTSSPETCAISRSKMLTYKTLEKAVKVPAIYSYTAKDLKYPVFLKPNIGQGSKGVCKADSYNEIKVALSKDDSLLILEYLPGEEYTVDCFTNGNGKLLFSQARERLRIANGISVRSKPIDNPEFTKMASIINNELNFRGVWFFQVKRNANGELVLMEIAPRVAGTMALCRMRGTNLPLLSLYDALGIEISMICNDFDIEIDRALVARYKTNIIFDIVYVDLDDTILHENKLNHLIVGLLYKFINDGKKIVLITKHEQVVESTLTRQRLSRDVFDEVIVLTRDQIKADYVSRDGIFIDDSFAERRLIYERLGIPVFDVTEAVELL